jgi:hypothetical protein
MQWEYSAIPAATLYRIGRKEYRFPSDQAFSAKEAHKLRFRGGLHVRRLPAVLQLALKAMF